MPPCKILIIDDDTEELEMLTTSMMDIGMTQFLPMHSAKDAFDYLSKIKDDKDLPKVIITDLNMPGIDGFEVIRTLKAVNRYHNIPVVVFSTSDHKDDKRKCISYGASDYHVKPNGFKGYLSFTRMIKEYTSYTLS